MSKAENYTAALKIVRDIPAWKLVPKSIQGFLLAGLADRDILGALSAAGLDRDTALLVVAGMLKSPEVCQVVIAFALGLIEKPVPPDSGTPKTETVQTIATSEPPAVPALASDIADQLAGLMTPSSKVIKAAADAEFAERILRDARKKPSSLPVSAWVN